MKESDLKIGQKYQHVNDGSIIKLIYFNKKENQVIIDDNGENDGWARVSKEDLGKKHVYSRAEFIGYIPFPYEAFFTRFSTL